MIENAEDLDIVMPMYNLLEYSENYLMTSGSLWNYYRDKIDDVDDNASDGKSFKYKTKIVGKSSERLPQPGNPGDVNRPAQPAVPTLNVEVSIPLKYLSNFWKFLDLPLINCEIELDLSRKKDCVLIERHNTAGVNFMITSTKLYVPVVTLSVNDNINFLENYSKDLKEQFLRTNYNLDYLIDPTFRNINILFDLLFNNVNDDPTRNSFNKYYVPLVEVKHFNALIDNKPFLISQ